MLAWIIILTVVCFVLIIAYYFVIKKLNDYGNKTDKLLDFDPFIDYNNPYHGKRLKSEDPYDSTPVFIMGIKSMVEEMDRYTRRPTIRYNSKADYTTFEDLEHRIDSIANAVDHVSDDVCGLDNRLDRHDNDICKLKERLDTMEDEVD